jgi:hypothetical protein
MHKEVWFQTLGKKKKREREKEKKSVVAKGSRELSSIMDF